MRNFFQTKGFLDVLTPPIVENPGMEVHIHPFEVIRSKTKEPLNKYLHTSPEFLMKELLSSEDFEKIFTISYCFRDEPSSPIHRNQFLMCEWYRKNERYESIMQDVQDLLIYLSKNTPLKLKETFSLEDFQKVTVQELFNEYLNFDILDFDSAQELKKKIEKDFKDVPLPSVDCSWDDYFFLLFLNKIETKLHNYKSLFIYEYPQQLSALSTLKKEDPRVCERFELYIRGVEICNCFNELTDFKIQKERFELQEIEKENLYNYKLNKPSRFLNIINNGYPQSAGIALGVERLFSSLVETESIFFD